MYPEHYAASEDTQWLHPEDFPPPKSTKILLYLYTGLAYIGHWDAKDCLLWMPLPKVSRDMKDRIYNYKEVL